jgi:hypothetical protein
MRRVLVLLASTALLLAGGCGGKSYEHRLDKTLELIRYRRQLDNNLMPAAKGKLETNLIFVRAPKAMEGMKEFAMTVLEPGKFDVAETLLDAEKKSSLHVLARIPKPATPANKKAAPEPANRGDFIADVVAELTKAYNVEIDAAKSKEESKTSPMTINKFKHLTVSAAGKTVQVYFYGTKKLYEVALIFEYPSSEEKALFTKIGQTLGAFATGEKAKRSFSGNLAEEEAGESGGGGGSPAPF